MRNATGFLLALKLFDKELLALALPVLSGFPTPGIVVLVAPRGGGGNLPRPRNAAPAAS